MKPRVAHRQTDALTLVDVLVIIVVLAVLAVLVLSALPRKHEYNWRKYVACVNNLKQVGLSFRIWEGDHNDKYPMQLSVTNGGTMELVAAGNVVATFQVMSNELATPKCVLCPRDTNRDNATNFTTDFNNSRISYFVGVDADENYPQKFLSGDANFEIGGAAVKSGLLEFSTNAPIGWTAARHQFAGNISLSDGSVQSLYNTNLASQLQQTGLATNRLAIP